MATTRCYNFYAYFLLEQIITMLKPSPGEQEMLWAPSDRHHRRCLAAAAVPSPRGGPGLAVWELPGGSAPETGAALRRGAEGEPPAAEERSSEVTWGQAQSSQRPGHSQARRAPPKL